MKQLHIQTLTLLLTSAFALCQAGCSLNQFNQRQGQRWNGESITNHLGHYENQHRQESDDSLVGQPVIEIGEVSDEVPVNSGRGQLGTIRQASYNEEVVVRGQEPGNGSTYGPPVTLQQPQTYNDPYVIQSQQDPVYQGGLFQGQGTVPHTGSPNELAPGAYPYAPVGNYATPGVADIDVYLNEAQTGRVTFGAAFNSDSGVVGQIIVDERNFDIMRFPSSFGEIIDGTAWRGAGQGFRLELVPGDEVQRYLVSFTEPYLFNTPVSFSASGYFFDRQFFDWDEQRLGGRFSLGYNLTPELSVSVGTRLENVNIRNPRLNTSADLNAAVGKSNLMLGNVSLTHDTRDHPFMATEGAFLQMTYHQGFGDFSYPRGDIDYRRYFLIYQRPDFSGRHTLSVGSKVGFSGSTTPVFENYFAGGFSTMRGFDFRGASPVQGGIRTGGEFQWLNSVEYTFPITADDMIKGVLFTDFGTVEENISLNSDNFRVAPGFGFRVHMPVGGAGGAPLAFDFAFPVMEADTDDKQVFSFYLGLVR